MSEVQPFWLRIPRFFAYGLHWRVLTVAACLALLNAYVLPGLFVIVLYAVTVRYAMAALQTTASGDLKPPALSWSALGAGYELPFKLFLILVVYGFFLSWVAHTVGGFSAMALYLIGSLLFPALVMMLVLSESLITALNPLGWVSLAVSIGWPYLALFGMWLAIGTAQDNASELLLSWVPEDLLLPFWLAVNTLFSVIAFHMMGYVLLQYHREIGDPLSAGRRLASEAPVTGLRTPLFEQLMRDGKVEAAAAELIGQVRQQPDNIDLRRQVHNFLLSHDQEKLLLENARGLLDELLAAGKVAPAAEIYSDCVARSLACYPRSPRHYLPLLRQLRRMGRAKAAVKLGRGFHKRFPVSDEVVPLYLEMAMALSDDLQRDDMAQQLLDFVLKQYPHHTSIDEVRRLHDILSKLKTQTV